MGIEALGKDAFLRLLTKQLEFQDPLKPMESTEFIAQLAQLRELESAMETSKTLGSLVSISKMLSYVGAAGLLGKKVEVDNKGGVSHEPGQTQTILYNLPEDASEVVLHLTDAAGNLVKSLTVKEPQGKGPHRIEWDGTDENGQPVPAGFYPTRGIATTLSGNILPIAFYTQGEVTAVSYENGNPFVTVNGSNLPIGSVVKILQQ